MYKKIKKGISRNFNLAITIRATVLQYSKFKGARINLQKLCLYVMCCININIVFSISVSSLLGCLRF